MRHVRLILILLFLFPCGVVSAQEVISGQGVEIDYSKPKTYTVGGVTTEGLKSRRADQVLSVLGIHEGDKIQIPGADVSAALKRIWLQRAFSTVGLYIDSLSASRDTAYLVLRLTERPRVIRWDFKGIRNSDRDELRERLTLKRGGELSDYVISTSTNIIKRYFKEKGFINAKVNVIQQADSIINNAVSVTFDITRGKKVKVRTITYEGNGELKFKLQQGMKKTKDSKWYNLSHPKSSMRLNTKDKQSLIDAFMRRVSDARIIRDSIYEIEEGRLGIHFVIDQGKRYYFRDITWTGNSEYTEEQLNSILRIEKGSIYDVVTMEKRLFGGDKENDLTISKLYRDQGYLFFNVTPVELTIEGDSVDVEMRMIEGKPATFNK